MRVWRIIAGAIAVGLFAWLGRGFLADMAPPGTVLGKAVPQFEAPDIHDRQVVDLSRYRGKVLLVNFWASWCEPCREEHANLQRLNEIIASHPGVELLGVAYRDRPADAREFLRRWGEGYPSLADPDGRLGAAFGVTSLPRTFLIDTNGIVRCQHIGPIGKAEVEMIVARWIGPALESRFQSCT